jgi:hypothetical protein
LIAVAAFGALKIQLDLVGSLVFKTCTPLAGDWLLGRDKKNAGNDKHETKANNGAE